MICQKICGFGAAFGLLMFLGCENGPMENPEWPARYPASGTVNYQGKPIEGADVTFTNLTAGSTGTGKTDADGKFQLTTYVENDGVVAGEHIVAIRRVDVVDNTPADVDLSAGGEAVPPTITWIIPEKYSNSAKSGLTATISETEPNEFTFDLE
ncbi:hypothetical protein Poly24_43170 [Rosistilla carotiformis]|uniref:Carboxypeptidase regulatory-like domain-containing protein n=1 Tax=Rosistilla carotiformis TaxID=2528017 RepID=A0A518JYH6_9BACT|nr:carboxypeptidase-like regulatory domain-containing protein [Rosistilla carotiformis]QDV70593.1 hypothetical protein Poly24_43170 [Rosistilla carotiformis]